MGKMQLAAPAPSYVTATPDALVAAAQRLTGSLTDHLIQNRAWQREAWDFYHAEGEFWYGTEWLANACSRVRLVAAVKDPGSAEPRVLDPDDESLSPNDRMAVDVNDELSGGVGGRSMMLKSIATKLSIPGEGYVVGEQRPTSTGELGPAVWTVRSTDEIRRREYVTQRKSTSSGPLSRIAPGQVQETGPSPYEVQIEENRWVPLADESIVCRVWQPDQQYSFRACSSALPALPILREIDLLNRRILAECVSRIAMNGLLLIPSEATFPTRPEFKDAADPFIAELIDIASKAIKTPGSAAATMPLPLKVPADLIEKVRHLPFITPLDPKLFEARDRAIKRLAATLNVPQEVVLGIADVNHWTAWQIDESSVKMHISPLVEVICHGLTVSYFRPRLEAAGMAPGDADRYVIWYDASELTTKPDLSIAAKDAHDRGVISDAAYRREAGFGDDDAPDMKSDDGLKQQVLVALALTGDKQAIGILWPDLEKKLAPPPQPGFDPTTGRPLAPEPPPGQPVKPNPAQPSGQEKAAPNGARVPATTGA